ncbi:sterol binding ankyrin repeat protein [Schizosaccharomyces octosporus yFS286]|uniref:Sterol binding ankyrin repeat protein n=1 Tax=Schizosaccharomyces octosporus (strain yFS286) TaxID=483514 RepID=S9RIZ8_SCHOY|nr:sterol binding ankyrin repeat protein [Schizosaccharomyces octosporus yFS286]EPX73989.1 sterol binding ankyrin repeat protein [Schizosaccharomyces octosporus yFS286]
MSEEATAAQHSRKASTSSSSSKNKKEIQTGLKQLQLLQAFQNGDVNEVDALLQNHSREDCTFALFLSIQCANASMVKHILSVFDVDLNAYDKNHNTPLHLAAMAGRQDIVETLLLHPDINYNLLNGNNLKAWQVASSNILADFMKGFCAMYTKETAREFKHAFQERNFDTLDYLMRHNEYNSAIDLNDIDVDTGQTYLHIAAKARDLELVRWLLNNNADPYRRDKFGKLPVDYTKDESLRSLFRNQTETTSHPPSSVDPNISGYLKKWTNYKSGYKLRWFSLHDGVLSYYKNQDDASSACRGSINLSLARLVYDPKQPTVFQVIGRGSVRYSVKANSPVEAHRWIDAISFAIEHDEGNENQKNSDAMSIGTYDIPVSTSRSATFSSEHLPWNETDSYAGSDDEHEGDMPHRESYEFNMNIAKHKVDILHGLINSAVSHEKYKQDPALMQVFEGIENAFSTLQNNVIEILHLQHEAEIHYKRKLENATRINALWAENLKTVVEEQDQIEERYHRSENHRRRTKRELRRLVSSMKNNPNNGQINETASLSSTSLSSDFSEEDQDNDRETFFDANANQTPSRIQSPSKETPPTFNQYPFDDAPAPTAGKYPSSEAPAPSNEQPPPAEKPVSHDERYPLADMSSPSDELNPPPKASAPSDEQYPTEGNFAPPRGGQHPPAKAPVSPPGERYPPSVGASSGMNEKPAFQEKPPNVRENQQRPPHSVPSGAAVDRKDDEKQGPSDGPKSDPRLLDLQRSFQGYEAPLRTDLGIKDDRPKISLWSILKGMIGKDMTKMALPVSFNEPTSLLQRVAEDMEYTDLLEIASQQKDPAWRVLYVAAFAASEYASTINRVAKPFNPLLGETYEFCRPDKGYRFLIEQVSHHPPIGAACAESLNWKYYGESSVKSKFYGKSFDISPLGTWYLELRNPSGNMELFTWKKITSSVVGIISGNPTIDNYGQMLVQNHSSHVNCLLDFKPRGWRGTNAYEVKGSIQSTSDTPEYTVNGHWNDKIFAYNAGSNKTMIWQNHERPPRPFNLTPFAISLNALSDELKPWLPPTDTRLRPDQRAMEDGQYDFAADEKNRVEEKQRDRRRMRDQGQMEEWKPKWFSLQKHPITGEDYWKFNGEYWSIREAAGKARLSGQSFEWPGVEDIF